MLGVMEKQLESQNIPWGYPLCFNEDCPLREKCLHYRAYLLKSAEQLSGPAIYPITAIITATTNSRPNNRQTSWLSWLNMAIPMVWLSTITKLSGTSTDKTY